ncbi:ubiquitin-protein ligase [Lithospermum erythrorhizon]|uniref:RING-type E3 ubiquitin transferase n=1 Tax=Lithospermum erythrorhizon TaxID=34254 RepID=A0AAV3NW33_LITER
MELNDLFCRTGYMDNKRAVSRPIVPKKGPGIPEKSAEEDEDAQFCKRIGCNGRLNHAKGIQVGCSEKTKPLTPPSGSSSRKEIVKISLTVGADVANRKRALPQRRSHSHQKTDNDGLDGATKKLGISPSSLQTRSEIRSGNKEIGCGKTKLSGVGSSSVSSNIRPWRKAPAISGNGKQNASPGTSMSSSSKATSSVTSCGLVNVRCSKISDVIPSSPPTESMVHRRGEIRQRDPDGESSSSGRGKKLTGHSSYKGPSTQPKSGISISDVRSSRKWTSGITIGPASVTNGRSRQINNKVAHSDRGKRNNASVCYSTSTISGSRRRQTPNNSEGNASYQCSPEGSSSHSSSMSTSVGSDVLGSIPSTSTGVGITHFRNRDAYLQYNIDDIVEVLMDLERIDQSGEMTYERLLALETNLFLSSLNVLDQHSGMRMDIDNMSYEELLALEEKMGNVSTALSEDAITKCLQRSIYQPQSSEEAGLDFGHQNDIKCSICQEEYVVGDEIGNLGCEHSYHVQCIEQWLRVKSWCPVCKGSAARTDSSSQMHHT